jgi:hypothetical protein
MPRLEIFPAVALGLLIACGANVDVLDGDGGADGTGNANGGASAQGGQGNSGQGNSAQGGAGQGASAQGGDGGGANPSGSGGSSSTGMVVCDAQGPCGQCVAEACPDLWCNCVSNGDCLDLYGCTFQCPEGQGNDECLQDCLTAFPDGISDAILVNDCAAGPCESQCPQAGDELSPCEECMYSTCPDAMNTCLANPECLDLFACLSACDPNDLSCHQGCYNQYPDGIEDLEDVIDCTSGPCADPCG